MFYIFAFCLQAKFIIEKLLKGCNNIYVIILPKIYKEIALSHSTVQFGLSRQNIKFKTTFRNCVYRGLVNREWKETDGDDWNVMWCEKEQIDWVF